MEEEKSSTYDGRCQKWKGLKDLIIILLWVQFKIIKFMSAEFCFRIIVIPIMQRVDWL